MRVGLRLQILLLVGGLLALALAPLLWAESALARLTIERVERQAALDLGRSVAEAELSGLNLKGKLQPKILAVWVLQPHGREASQWGKPAWLERLARPGAPIDEGALHEVDRQRGLVVAVVGERGTARVAVALEDPGARVRALMRSFGLYTGLVALALLLATYVALGRLVLHPLDRLAHAAGRVAGGSRRWEVLPMPARELDLLEQSLRTMTARLLDEEEELRHRIDEVNAATERLKEAQDRLIRSERLASVGRLAAGLAHEIGNPLASLIGLEDCVIAGGLSAEEQADFLSRMRRETERIHRVLRDLLDFARPSQVLDASVGKQPGDVKAAIDDVLSLVRPQKVMKEVGIECELEEPLTLVSLPNSELVQVLLNLLLNAADALGGEGRIVVRARNKVNGVRIDMEDNGPGLPHVVRERLFEPFVTTKEIGKGTGLGLAVCRGLIESAGGILAWDASFASGTRFVIELPAFTKSEMERPIEAR